MNRIYRFSSESTGGGYPREMSLEEWVMNYADRLEEVYVPWESFIDRRKWNRLDGDEQREYEQKLKKKASSPQYRAWRGEVFHEIPRALYMKALKHLAPR